MPVKTRPIKSPVKQALPGYSKAELSAALSVSRSSIAVGSKSFSLAALLFDRETRDAAFALYGWCRYCDDQIDNTVGDQAAGDEPSVRLEKLVQLTRACYAGEKMQNPIFIAFQFVTSKYKIPIEYPLDLLEGMSMDVENQPYETIGDLLVYCYRVAGTVGLMMSHIMGISDERALMHAANLGKAMQLTNIARDIMEDADRGRIYLPRDWMREIDLKPNQIKETTSRLKVAALVRRILAVASVLYQSGDQGIKYLSVRAACAIVAARLIYSEIGSRVIQLKEAAWDKRTVVSFRRKVWLISKATMNVLSAAPRRLRNPWKPISIRIIWKNT